MNSSPVSAAAPRGRPPKISRDAIVSAGIAVGLPQLKIKTVAKQLGVTATALYHHVADLEELRRAVGSQIASTIELPHPPDDPADYLVELGLVLRDVEGRHPGIGSFFVTDGQHCEITRNLMAKGAEQLTQFGLSATDAQMLTGIASNLALSFASREREEPEPLPPAVAGELLTWVLGNLVRGLLADVDNAPWNKS